MIISRELYAVICLLITAATYAADNNYYLRLNDDGGHQVGELLTFPKKRLQDFKTLAHMHEDLVVTQPDLGTAHNPFQAPASDVPAAVFTQLIDFLNDQRRHEAGDDVQKMKTFIWDQLKGVKNRYSLLYLFVLAENYLDINPIFKNALKLCIIELPHTKRIALPGESIKTETLDDALEAGLPTISLLDPDTLFALKYEIVEKLRLMAEQILMNQVNNHQTHHPQVIVKLPDDLKPHIYFAQMVDIDTAVLGYQKNNDAGRRINHFEECTLTATLPNNIKHIAEFFTIRLGHYKSLTIEKLKQELLPEFLKTLSIQDIHKIFPVYPSPNTVTNIISGLSFICYNCSRYNREFNRVISNAYICLKNNKTWIFIPNGIFGIYNFKDKTNQEKLICAVGDVEDQQKIVIIDPQLHKITVANHMNEEVITAAYLCESLYIYNVEHKENKSVAIQVYDLDKNITTAIPLNQSPITKYVTFIAAPKDPVTVSLFGFGRYSPEEPPHFDTFTIDHKTHKLTLISANQKPPFEDFFFDVADRLQSKLFFIDLKHPNFDGLVRVNPIWKDGTLYMSGFAASGSCNLFVYEYIPNHALEILEALKNFTEYTVEQLYAIGEIFNRMIAGTFTSITMTETGLFYVEKKDKDGNITRHKLQEKDNNLLFDIIDWSKKSIYEKPTRDFTGKKRKASPEPTASDEPPAEKQKTEKDDKSDHQ